VPPPPPPEAPRDGRRGGASILGALRIPFGRALRTTAFRVTLLHLALTLLGTAALAAVTWWATTGFAARQLAQEVERDVAVLVRAARAGGAAAAGVLAEARIAANRAGTEYYLVAGPDRARVAGNLAEAPWAAGWRRIGLQREDGSAATLLAHGARLPGGGYLVAARDLGPVERLEARLLGAAGWVAATALLLGLAGGIVVGRGVARRAAAMEAALAAVEAGEIGRRLPGARADGDEFERLSARINATLDRLEALMDAVRQVTDDIAHDLRTPLSRLRQRLEAALREGTARDAAGWAEAVEGAIADCDRILAIFAALLRIAQVKSGARRAGFRRFDLSAVVQSVAEVYAPAAEERGQALEARIAPGVTAWGDPELVTQMLANLTENAVRHGREGGHAWLVLEPRAGGGAAVVVADDGPGIPEAERARVLRRFHRLDAARSRPGSGLGLALAAAVAELHGMTLTLGDNAPGLRATVEVPAPPSEQADPPRSAAA
jgi:signal transduction histidine kinase